MSLHDLLEELRGREPTMVSTDLFDTILLRDGSTETSRLAEASRRSAAKFGLDPRSLARLRWMYQENAYRAVAAERPAGEASLTDIYRSIASLLHQPAEVAAQMHHIEVEVDAGHLSPNKPVVDLLREIRAAGTRVIAVSDTYYSTGDLEFLLSEVVGSGDLFDRVYASSDIGQTKHWGGIFSEVSRREDLSPDKILHIGDNWRVDVVNARSSGWAAVHIPRERSHGLSRQLGRARSIRELRRRLN